MRGDFHSHSNYSDGYYPVDEVVKRAKEHGLDVLGLTDHDSVFGVEEAFEYGKKIGLLVIKGLELSTTIGHDNCHLIGYFKHNIVPQAIFDFSRNIIESRRARATKMMESIRDTFNVKIDLDDLFKGTIITRGNMMTNLLKNNPDKDKKELSFMVSNESPCYIPASKMSAADGVKLLKENGATIILAHPTLMDYKNVCEVVKMGIDGLECIYPKNKEGEEAKFRNLAKENNLFVSAGSDFHGDYLKHAEIGTCYLEGKELETLLNVLEIEV
jgi:predicted metal-dependent phosphoesterase TrpH